MTSSAAVTASNRNDAELVQQSLAGDRQAFGQIVARYQSLVCALAYSGTGNRSRSEDLAQETFFTAWRKLRDLREPARLCSWLCGITRHLVHGDFHRLERQPAHDAVPLDCALDLAATEPLPTAQAISNEEMAILWREVGRLPETYREPLVLYYRENKSVERVAAALELTPDAVMQRLTRGRRMLQERMLEFVETTLQRTNPGPQFTLRVECALPMLASSGPAAAVGGVSPAAAKGGVLGFLLAWIAPLVGTFAAIGVSWSEIAHAPTARERRYVARWMLGMWLCAAALVVALPTIAHFVHSAGVDRHQDWTATAPFVAAWFGFALIAVTLIVLMTRGKVALRRQLLAEGGMTASSARPVSLVRSIAMVSAVLTAIFWVLIFMAWQCGDRVVAAEIVGLVVLLVAAPFVYARLRPQPTDATRSGGWYLAACGLVFLAILNWRLDVWLARAYAVDLPAIHRLLPPGLVQSLSLILVGWIVLLVFVTRPDEKR